MSRYDTPSGTGPTGGASNGLDSRLGSVLERLAGAFTWSGGSTPVDRPTVLDALCRDAAQLHLDLTSTSVELEAEEYPKLCTKIAAIEESVDLFVDTLAERAIQAANELDETCQKFPAMCRAETHHRTAAEALHRLLVAHGCLCNQFPAVAPKLSAAGARVAEVIAKNEVPRRLSNARGSLDRELDSYGPRLGQVFRFKAAEAPTHEQLIGAATAAARAWVGVLVALAKAMLASANYNLLTAFRSNYNVHGETAKAIADHELRKSTEARKRAITGFIVAQRARASEPKTVYEWQGNEAYQPLITLVSRAAVSAALTAQAENEQLLDERREQFQSAIAKESGDKD